MYAPELYIPEMSYSEFVEQNKNDELIKEFSATSTSIEELIAKCVFVNTIRTYGNKVEPLLTMGITIMSPFVDIIFNKTTKPIILSQKELLDLKNLHDVLKEGGIHLHCLKDTELKNILLEELSNIPEELNIFKNPSLVFIMTVHFGYIKMLLLI